MVQSLAQTGLRVVMDVVYNHTHTAGQDDPASVLDRVVPDYYYRLDCGGRNPAQLVLCRHRQRAH